MNTNIPKSRNQFAALSEDDRQLILNLCAQHPYDHVVELLRQPRAEAGLDIAPPPPLPWNIAIRANNKIASVR